MRLTILSCLVLLWVPAAPASAQQRAQGFQFRVSRDEFDDSERSFVYTLPLATDDSRSEANLMWRCMDDGLNVIYYFDKYLAGNSDENVRVRYRIDDRPATEFEFWGMMTTNKGTWMPMHQIPGFTTLAERSARIVVEVEDPVDSERIRDSFSLEGLSAALQRLRCR